MDPTSVEDYIVLERAHKKISQAEKSFAKMWAN